MNNSHTTPKHLGEESPWNHILQWLNPILFLLVWGLDSFLLHLSDFLNDETSLVIRISLFGMTLLIGGIFIYSSHQDVIQTDKEEKKLITHGVYSIVRHPMYLGSLIIYIAFLFLSLSIISMLFFIVIAFSYNLMANYEENSLKEILGEEYQNYMNNTPKWVPYIW